MKNGLHRITMAVVFDEAWGVVKAPICDRIMCDKPARPEFGPGNFCSKECMEAQRAYDGE